VTAVKLEPQPGFDWTRVQWGAPTAVQSDDCSYCGAAIPDEIIPLRLWTTRGWAAVFCEACMRTWWGIESFDDESLEDGEGDA
jgi:hypothetical protein